MNHDTTHPGQTAYDARRSILLAALQAAGETLSRPGAETEDAERSAERSAAETTNRTLGAELENLCRLEIAAGADPRALIGDGLPPVAPPPPRRAREATADSVPQPIGNGRKESTAD